MIHERVVPAGLTNQTSASWLEPRPERCGRRPLTIGRDEQDIADTLDQWVGVFRDDVRTFEVSGG